MTPTKRVFFGIAAAAVILLCVAPFAWNAWTRHALDAAKARCRAAGLPMTVEEIRPAPIPDAENAAPLLEKISALMKAEAFAGSESEPGVMGQILDFKERHRERHLDAVAASDLAKALDRPDVETIVALAREAAGRRGCDAHLDYSQGAKLFFPFISPMLDSIKLLGAHAWLAASRHQTEVPCADVWAMFQLAEFPAREPMLITHLTRIAGEGLTLDALEKIAAAGSLPPAWAEKFAAHLHRLELTKDFVRCLDGERVVFGGWAFENVAPGEFNPSLLLDTSDGEPTLKARLFWRFAFGRFLRLDYAFYLDRMRLFRSEVENTAQGEVAQGMHLKEYSDGAHVTTCSPGSSCRRWARRTARSGSHAPRSTSQSPASPLSSIAPALATIPRRSQNSRRNSLT